MGFSIDSPVALPPLFSAFFLFTASLLTARNQVNSKTRHSKQPAPFLDPHGPHVLPPGCKQIYRPLHAVSICGSLATACSPRRSSVRFRKFYVLTSLKSPVFFARDAFYDFHPSRGVSIPRDLSFAVGEKDPRGVPFYPRKRSAFQRHFLRRVSSSHTLLFLYVVLPPARPVTSMVEGVAASPFFPTSAHSGVQLRVTTTHSLCASVKSPPPFVRRPRVSRCG